jgi:transposase
MMGRIKRCDPPWSNGPVAGHIDRLNMLKRSMCGRATLDLLSRRLLLAACPFLLAA